MVAGVTAAELGCFWALPATVTGDAGLGSGKIAVSSQRRLTTERGVCEWSVDPVFCISPGLWTTVDCERAVLKSRGSTDGFWRPPELTSSPFEIGLAAAVSMSCRVFDKSRFNDTKLDDGP
jgi:hypothetical protein